MHDWNSVYSTLAGELYGVERRALQAALELACAEPDLRVSELLVSEGLLDRDQDRHLSSLVDEILDARNADGGVPPENGNSHPPHATQRRYTVRSVHARGGIGRVLVAWDPELEREVAIKELQGTPPPHVVERFLREARITARLEHPSIIPIYEILKRPDGSPYYAMKLVRGTTLRKAIEERSSTRDRLALLPHFLDLCQAIAYAHSRDVIHRDIKSSNVMIGEFGETLVIDWGLAKHVGDPSEPAPCESHNDTDGVDDTALTIAGQIIGTPNYMPPEQARGELEKVDQRSDVYALGAVLYEVLCGDPPLSGESRSVVVQRASRGEIPSIDKRAPDAPRALIAICRKAMAFDSKHRYASAGELAADVSRFQSGLLVQAYRYSAIGRAARLVRRHSAIVSVALALVALALTLVFWYGSMRRAGERTAVLARESEKRLYDVSIREAYRYVDEGHFDEAVKALNEGPMPDRNWEWGRLQRIFNEPTHILRHDGARVWTGDISPDGRLLLTTDNLSVVLWDLATGTQLHRASAPGTISLDFHPDGNEFASSDDQSKAFLWDVETFAVKLELADENTNTDGHRRSKTGVSGIRYTPDGDRFLTVNRDGHATLRDRKRGEVLRQWFFEDAELQRLAIEPGGTRAAAASRDGRVMVWDLESAALLFEFESHKPGNHSLTNSLGGALGLTFTPGRNILTTCGDDGRMNIWDLATGEMLANYPAHAGALTSAVFTRDGETAITTSYDRVVRLWDMNSLVQIPSYYRFPFAINEALITPDEQHMVLCTEEGTASVWPLHNRFGEFVLKGHTDGVFALDFSPDGSLLVSGAGHWEQKADNRAIVWDMRTGRQAFVLSGHESAVFHAEFFPDGRRVLTASRDHGVFIWDALTGLLLRTLPSLERYYGISSLALSPDGQTFVAAGWPDRSRLPCEVALWRTDDGAMIRQFTGAEGHVEAVAFSPDGSRVAGATEDGMWSVWDVRTGELLLTSGGPQQKYQSLVFSPDGHSILTVGVAVPLQLWDADTGELIRDFVANHPIMERAAFSPGGKRIVTGHGAGIRVVDIETGNVFATLPFPAWNVAFSPDGLVLAAGCVDHTVRVWEALPWDQDYDGTYWTDFAARVKNATSR